MNAIYPMMLRLDNRACVVVGGGVVAARKVASLIEAGALVIVISPRLCAELEGVAAAGVIAVRRETYQPGAIADIRPLLVFAATDNPDVNQRIAGEAQSVGALVNVADLPDSGDFENPATIRRGPITLSVSTGGASPTLAAHLRDRMGEAVGEEYATLARWMGARRADVGATVESPADRAELWRSILRSPVLDMLRRGDNAAARDLFDRLIGDSENAPT